MADGCVFNGPDKVTIPHRQKVIVLLLGRGVAGLAQAAALVLLARWTGVADFGIIAAWTGAFLVIAGVLDFGLAGFILVRRAQGENGDVRTALVLNRVGTLGAGLIAYAILLVAGPAELFTGLMILAIAIALEKNTDTSLNVALADGNVILSATSILIRRIGSLAMFVALYTFVGVDALISYSASYLAFGLIAQIQIGLVIWRSRISSVTGSRPAAVLSASRHFMMQFVAGQLRTLDAAIVGLVSGAAQAGLYGAATRFSAPILLVPGAIAGVLTPAAAAGGPRVAQRLAWRVLILAAASLVFVLLLSPFVPQLLDFVLGEQFSAASSPMVLALIGTVFIGFSTPVAGILQTQGKARFVGIVSVLGAGSLLGGVFAGSLLAGAAGAGWALVASGTIVFLIQFFRLITLPDAAQPGG